MHRSFAIFVDDQLAGRVSIPGAGDEILLEVQAGFRRQGYGRRLMKMICDEADRCGERLTLLAAGTPMAMSTEQLETWYARFGFVKRPDTFMVRLPRVRK